MHRWLTYAPTLLCPNTLDGTNGMKKGPYCHWTHGHQAAWARRGRHGESSDGRVPWGRSVWPWRTWKEGKSEFKVSDNVVLTTYSSSLSPWAIRAVEAMVSCRDGWSNHEILSVTSISPRSNKEALAARLVFAGLSLNEPLDVDTACLKILYWAAEIFLLSLSSPS